MPPATPGSAVPVAVTAAIAIVRAGGEMCASGEAVAATEDLMIDDEARADAGSERDHQNLGLAGCRADCCFAEGRSRVK